MDAPNINTVFSFLTISNELSNCVVVIIFLVRYPEHKEKKIASLPVFHRCCKSQLRPETNSDKTEIGLPVTAAVLLIA
jgi:hypothetical protein